MSLPVSPIIRIWLRPRYSGQSRAVITGNERRGQRFTQGVEAGMTHIDDLTIRDYPHVMFGGEKNSGLGLFNGHWIIEEFTTDHLVTVLR
ncbi:acyl-CoA reductase-like NAD-dependent aldehyde dehydrogenase [Labrenzia sp. MBR-25]|jgi:aldehyde dehydrogenase (NAD+)